MSESTTDENLQRFASSPYAPSWQKEVVADLYAARERIRQLEERIKSVEFQYGSGPDRWCSFCGKHFLGNSSPQTDHYDDCEAFTPEGEVK